MFFLKKTDDIETDIEVKTDKDVDFDVQEGWVDPITKIKRKRQAKKAEEERRRIEEEKRRKAEESKSKMIGLFVMLLCIGISLYMANVAGNNDDLEDVTSTTVPSEESLDEDALTDDEGDVNSEEDEELELDPKELSGEDVLNKPTEEIDFGYVKIRARVSYHSSEGGWSFYLLNSDGSRGPWFEIEGALSSESLDEYSEDLFNNSSSKYAEVKDYIFTMTGYGSWEPVENPENEVDEDGGKFIFDPYELIEVVYDNEDKALIYN